MTTFQQRFDSAKKLPILSARVLADSVVSWPDQMKMKIVVLSALIGIATAPGLAAKIVQYPEKNPLFSVTIPDSWTCKLIRDGDLECNADEPGLGFQVIPKKWEDEEEMKAMLPSIGEKIGSKLKDMKVGKVQEMTTSGKMKLLRIDVAGTSNGVELTLWLAAFKTANKPYIMMTGALAKVRPEHQKTIAQILNSIAPVESKADTKRSAREFDPYKGSLAALLPAEFSDSLIKFKRTAISDKTSTWKEEGAVEAVSFSYDLVSIVIVKLEGQLLNFASSADAVGALKAIAEKNGATVTPKGDGRRFSARNGKLVGWTNGSLMCVVMGGTDPAAGNFEKAAPF
jgi:hypothetical protein